VIFEESRYEHEPTAPVQGSDGVYRVTIQPRLGSPDLGEYTLHSTTAGDRMDLLADQAYGDPEFWWRIAEANPELDYPDTIPPGTVLRIPMLATGL
jgi:nucleoid-associated protein YgaU